MILTTIVVSGIVFSIVGIATGYILGFVDAKNHYKIKHQ